MNKSPLVLIGVLILIAIATGNSIDLLQAHIKEDSVSHGALFRGGLNLLAATAFFTLFDNQHDAPEDILGLRMVAVLIVLTTFALILYPKSAILDRLGLFFFPFQIYMTAKIPAIFSSSFNRERFAVISVLAGCWVYLLAWFEFGVHREFWLPYRNLLL